MKSKPETVFGLTSEEIADFLSTELKAFQKDLEKLYREDVAFHPTIPRDDVHQYIEELAKPYLDRFSHHYFKAHHQRHKGIQPIRAHIH